ncbi:hypothetical protein NDU88_009940 [Pleurodeles waltl]|uniref:Uncharacterized protein n=1 Tax=Pleurodeles waltl TaxID=8319 RepID=A0AAV7QUY0_PLEWA|nr:hypothetical protein NDU88_009940 [Pleurodeles waltl]
MRMRETVLAEVAQRSPTSPETNLESRAMQVRVPWTQAWLCTKDFRRKCTGAGVAAKSRFPAMQPSEWKDPSRLGESCRSVFPPEGRQQTLLEANCAFGVFGRCWGPRRTRRSQIGPEERGDVEQDKEPSLKQVAPGEVPETGTTRMRETVLAEVAQRSPTSPETNLESRAMQVRVPWTQAWLCTKDFCRKCTGAGVASKVAVPSIAAQRGEARTYLHQTWTEESLDCGDHLDRVAGFEGPRSSC